MAIATREMFSLETERVQTVLPAYRLIQKWIAVTAAAAVLFYSSLHYNHEWQHFVLIRPCTDIKTKSNIPNQLGTKRKRPVKDKSVKNLEDLNIMVMESKFCLQIVLF